MGADPAVLGQFKAWSKSRDEFHTRMAREAPQAGSDKWQKHYCRGVDAEGQPRVDDHQTKLRLAPFARSAVVPPRLEPRKVTQSQSEDSPPVTRSTDDGGGDDLALRKRDWLLDVVERHRELSPTGTKIERRINLSREEFLERYYAANRPVILVGEMAEWPALSRWTPSYLREAIGSTVIEYQGERTKSTRFEMYKDVHRREMPFDHFIERITTAEGNDSYLTAYNSTRNVEALSVLHRDLGFLDKFLSRDVSEPHGMMWIGPAGTVTSLHHPQGRSSSCRLAGGIR